MYVKYAAILNLLINVSHAGAGAEGSAKFMDRCIQHVDNRVMV